MYIGKHHKAYQEGEDERERIRVPENYAGNAFAPPPVPTEIPTIGPEEEPNDECEAPALPACMPSKRPKSGIFPRLDKLFSSDALLILLAILLSGDDEGGELAVLLLLLLLF